MRDVISIDIGSTYTKGARFCLRETGGDVLCRANTPTTVEDLEKGFNTVLKALTLSAEPTGMIPPIYVSSSAKGGLRIVAVGLVPALTLKAAQLTACSAGGRVVKAFAFKLTQSHIAEIRALAPDILLLAGGTDGGNEDVVRHNIRKLAEADLGVTVMYAGNQSLVDEVGRLFVGQDVSVCENIMPDVNRLNPDPARAAIRRVFLERIVKGNGLSGIAARAGLPPKPTPRAVLDLVKALADSGWDNLAVVDMGGATTDYYTVSDPVSAGDAVLYHGLPEPSLKRSVEGDLGMRVSARSLLDSGAGLFESWCAAAGISFDVFARYVARVSEHCDLLPADEDGKRFDGWMARACVSLATVRHAGRLREAYTPAGKVYVQTGKDLRSIRTVIGTGGYLSRCDDGAVMRLAASGDVAADEIPLLPESFEYRRDVKYLFPLLGNVAEAYPEVAAAMVKQHCPVLIRL